MAFAYYIGKDGHRKSLPVDKAQAIQAALDNPTPDLSPEQNQFLDTIDRVVITKRIEKEKTKPLSRLQDWERQKEDI